MKSRFYTNLKAAFLVAVLASISVFSAFSQTSITNEAGLKAMLTNDATASYVLANDITLSSAWTPLGTDASPFKGTFDGNGHVIKNLQINQITNMVGFFGKASGAIIKNIGFENARVVGANQQDVAIIVGKAESTVIEKCYAVGYVEGRDHVATIVGGSTTTTVRNCYAYAQVVSNAYQPGGLVGTSNQTDVLNSYFAGQVSCETQNTGGIVALMEGSVESNLKNTVSMASLVKGGADNTGRILGNIDNKPCVLDNNYAYEGTLVNGAVVAQDNPDATATGKQGASTTLTSLKTKNFYATTMNWDMENTWSIVEGTGFPLFKGQSVPANVDYIVGFPSANTILAMGEDKTVSATSVIPGKTVYYSSSNPSVATVSAGGVITSVGVGTITISAYTQDDAFSKGATATFQLEVIAQVNLNITTAQDLFNIRYKLDGEFSLMNDIDLAGTPYENWEPIVGFTGTLSGNGHIIKNYIVNKPEGNQVGFFSTTLGATITKLGVEGASVIGGAGTSNGADVGVLIGRASGTTIKECYTTDSYVEGRDHVAGIIGGSVSYAANPEQKTVIQDSYSTAIVKSRQYQAGGIIGTAVFTDVINCYFSGTAETPNSNTGGIISLLDGGNNSIKNCVLLAPYMKGGRVDRILGNNNGQTVGDASGILLENNFSRVDMKRGTGDILSLSPLPSSDQNLGKDKVHGANIPFNSVDNAASSKQKFFYTDSLHWDFQNTWKMLTETGGDENRIYPVLKWQTAKVKSHMFGFPTGAQKVVAGSTLNYISFGSHGQPVSYTVDNDMILWMEEYNGQATIYTDENYPGVAHLTAQTEGTAYMQESTVSLEIEVVGEADLFKNISTAEEFNSIRQDMLGYYNLMADIDLSGYTNFEPIGTKENPFRGRLIGNNKSIKGLKIDRASTNVQGLFGYANGALFKDFSLSVHVVGSQDAGGLLGKGVGVKIERVAVTGYIEGNDHVGAISGGTDKGTISQITNCFANAQVVTRSSQVGGLVGAAQSLTIKNSYFTGTVTAPTGSWMNNAGGIVSLNEDDNVSLVGVASIAASITGGTVNEFVARGNAILELTNCFASSEMTLSAEDTSSASSIPKATAEQKKPLSSFKSQALYNTMGWDFSKVWYIEGSSLPKLNGIQTSMKQLSYSDVLNATVYAKGGMVYVKVENPSVLAIYDLTGRLVETAKIESGETPVLLPKGIYVVKLTSDKGSFSSKVLNK